MPVKRTRKKEFTERIITKDNLRSIYAFLSRQATTIRGATSEAEWPARFIIEPKITIHSQDEIKTESNEVSVFDNDVLDQIKTHAIEFSYSNYYTDHRIDIDLVEGGEYDDPRILFTIVAADPSWVDAAFAELDRIFSSFAPQSTVIKRYRYVLAVPLGLAIGTTFAIVAWPIFDALFPETKPNTPSAVAIFLENHKPLQYLFLVILLVLQGYFPALSVIGSISKLWPSIEFDFGPEHLKRHKAVRKAVLAILSILVMPLVVGFIQHKLGW